MNRHGTIVCALVLGLGLLSAFLFRIYPTRLPIQPKQTIEEHPPSRIEQLELSPGASEPLPKPDSSSLAAPPEPAIFLGASDVTILAFIRQLRKATGLNIVATGDLSGTVSPSLNGASWSIALEEVLVENKLQAEYFRNFLILRHGLPNSRSTVAARALPWEAEYRGKPVSLEIAQAAPRGVFEALAEQAKWNLVLDHDVVGPITAIGTAPWDEFLEAVLEADNLDAELLGNSLHVLPLDKMKSLGDSPAAAATSGVVRCVVGFTMKEGDAVAKRAEYAFEVPTGGVQAVFKTGPRVPTVTAAQLGGPPMAQYIDAFARLNMTARLGSGLPRQGWFEIDGEYTRVVEHSNVLNSKQSFPYLDTVKFNTALGVPENTRLSFAGFKDPITGREFNVDFSWSTVVPSAQTLPLRANGEKVVTQVTYDLGGKLARYWLLVTAGATHKQFSAGTEVPVVTPAQLNGPPTVQYINTFSRFNVQFQSQPLQRAPSDSYAQVTLDCEYTRLLNRPYATNSDNPYLDVGQFTGLVRVIQNQEQYLGQQTDPIQNRTTNIKFSWWPVQK